MGPFPYYYLDFTYCFAGVNPEVGHLDAVTTKSLLLANLKTFFGDSVAGIGFDLLVFRPGDRRGIIRCPASIYVKVRAALTLPAQFDQDIVSFRVAKASPLLTALLADSRTYEHKNYFTAKRKLCIESYSEEDEEMDTDAPIVTYVTSTTVTPIICTWSDDVAILGFKSSPTSGKVIMKNEEVV